MKKVGVGDMATRRSYGQDIVFYVRRILGTDPPVAQLIGVNVRLFADSPLDDLIVLDYRVKPSSPSGLKAIIARVVFERAKPKPQRNYRLEAVRADYVPIPGKVLHIDGEEHYLKQCLTLYRNLSVPVIGLHIPEAEQPRKIREVLEKHRPDILVITGHDGLLRKQGSRDFLINYRSSQYFVETVKQARLYDTNRDGLAIIAGACQSHFESLIEAGANFASAPERVMIHCYDPVFVAEKLAYTPFTQVVDLPELFYTTISGKDGIGGIETRGKLRQGFPRLESWLPTESYT
ncbi:MAG: sporulation peptidase YabG [Firmicutes bacterium]|jgi:spore coat assembly protein|nr:sporulation peptidase YabG [Bacillota bacterium]NLL87336.1 sporulation peptidase YabG [Bacillota bacterium]HKM17377.1 sporulation peptidase YabG [Limnochordia bacterium]